ncbi:glycosyltransferase family 2 protein [Ostreiculturibacter nitratireducens]|uniref:glycosyltransferase family 2 protein n=1 Tax=Ostreiculturibacter nitratireducens TaxID=3075226 RepID=UPI0031B5D7FD
MALTRHKSPHGTVMAVSMMKDEAPFLLEWFAHHLAVGFTDILVYTNDCTDGTVEMLQRLEELGLGYHRHNVIREGVKPQPSAIAHAENEPLVAAADWVMLFDADEFLCINHPSGTLDGMLADAVARDANGIVITWRIFGSGFVTDWSRAPVTEQYLYAAPPLWRMGWGVKTLFKYDPEYWRLGIHRPKIKNKHLEDGFPDTVRWLNGSGQPMEDYFKFRGWRSIRRTLGYDWAQLNHYAIKSIDSYAIRKFRGNVNNKKDKYNADYWSLQDRNEVRDEKISRHFARRREIMNELLADPVLGRLHEAAMQRVEARLEDYRKTDAYAELKESLLRAGEVPITQVTAKPPQARDPLKIASLMSEVEKKSGSRPVEERRTKPSAEFGDMTGSPYLPGPVDLSSPVPVEIVENRGLKVPADLRLFAPDALETLIAGKFERRAARQIVGATVDARRMLDATEGFGFVAQLAAQAHPALRVMIQQERSDLIEFARRVAELNGLVGRVSYANGPLVMPGDSEETGARGLAHCIRDFRPDVLRIGAAALAPAWVKAVDLAPLKRVLLLREADEALAEAWNDVLTAAGFERISDGQKSGTSEYRRS